MIPDWPRARPAPGDRATFKAVPEDFRVTELPGFDAEGAGEHLYLYLEKRAVATVEVARWLGECFQVGESAVGYAGMKDKQAVAEQWFSVHTPLGAEALPARPDVGLRGSTRHRRKLRRGQLAGNRFGVRLRDLAGETWQDGLAAVRHGVPNYFGPQRFGGDNLERARAWLARRSRRRARNFRSGLHLSVLRSFLFNEVLAARVRTGTWNRLLPGDVAQPPGAAGAGCEAPTGPLWGRGRSAAEEQALELERQALAPHGELCDGLEHAGLAQQRRSLVLKPDQLSWQQHGTELELSFVLPAGSYATVLLGEVFALSTPEARG